MSAIKESQKVHKEAQKALVDFYHNLPNKHKWKLSGPNPTKAMVEQMEQYLKQYNVPKISNREDTREKGGRRGFVGGDGLNAYIGDRDVFFYSGHYLGYHLADGGGGYVHMRDMLHADPDYLGVKKWSIHPRLLYSWSHSFDTWDITDLVLKKKSHPLLNWLNENPFEVKQ